MYSRRVSSIIDKLPPLLLLTIAMGFYIFNMGNSPYWLDSPELSTSVFLLALSHPPSHPLYEIAAKLLTFVPVGSISMRVNLFSCACSLISILLIYLISVEILNRFALIPQLLSRFVSCMAIVPVVFSSVWIHQSVWTEVYSLQCAILLGVIYLVIVFLHRDFKAEIRLKSLVVSVFLLVLSFTNHPFISLLLVPPVVFVVSLEVVSNFSDRLTRLFIMIFVLFFVGISVYLYVPIRSNLAPDMVLGAVNSVSDFFWTVSAKVYHKSISPGGEGFISTAMRGVEALFMMMDNVTVLYFVFALGGIYFIIRNSPTVSSGLFLFVFIVVSMVSRMLMDFDRNNPDVGGYLMPALGVLPVCTIGFVGALFKVRGGRFFGILALVGIFLFFASGKRLNLKKQKLERNCAEAGIYQVERAISTEYLPFSNVISSFFSTSFFHYYFSRIGGQRPDVVFTAMEFWGYKGVAEEYAEISNNMKRVIRGYLSCGHLRSGDVAQMALSKFVYLEPYPQIADEMVLYMLPSGLFFQVASQPVSRKDRLTATEETGRWIEGSVEMLEQLGCFNEVQTKRYYLWVLYNRALVFARMGEREGAIHSCRLALRIQPGVVQIEKLLDFLQKNKRRIKNLKPFLP